MIIASLGIRTLSTIISTAVHDLLKIHKTTEATAEALLVEATKNKTLAAALLANGLKTACYAAVRRTIANMRNVGWREAANMTTGPRLVQPSHPDPKSEVGQMSTPPIVSAQSVYDATAIRAEGLLDTYRVKNGKALRDSTRQEIAVTVKCLEEAATDRFAKSTWLRRILDLMPNDNVTTAGNVVTDEQLREIQIEVLGTAHKSDDDAWGATGPKTFLNEAAAAAQA